MNLWPTPLPVDGDDRARQTAILHSTVRTCLIICVVSLPFAVGTSPYPVGAALVQCSLVTILLILRKILIAGHVFVFGLGMTALMWGAASAAVISQGGIRSSSMGLFVVTIIVATLCLGRRTAFLTVGLCVITIFSIVGLHQVEILGPFRPMSPSESLVWHTSTYALTGILFVLPLRMQSSLLQTLTHKETALAKTLADLQQTTVSLESLESTLAAVGDALFVTDGDARIVLLSCSAARWVGTTREKLEGTRIKDVLKPSFDTDSERRGEATLLARDGSSRPVWLSVAILGEDGGPSQAVWIASDLSQQKSAEEALLRHTQVAIEGMRAKSRFLAGMSHELRTPLNAIIGYAQVIQEDMEDCAVERGLTDVQHIETAGRALFADIEDVLLLARIEAGRLELEPEPVIIHTLIKETISSLEGVEAPISVLDAPEQAWIVDRRHLQRLLASLLTSLQRKWPRPLLLEASVHLEDATPSATFDLRLDGVHLGEEALIPLFDPHLQSSAEGEIGLGLHVAREIAHWMNGQVLVETADGALLVHVSLPVQRPEGQSP